MMAAKWVGPVFGRFKGEDVESIITISTWSKYGQGLDEIPIATVVNPHWALGGEYPYIEAVHPITTDADNDPCRTFSLRQITDATLAYSTENSVAFTAWLQEPPKASPDNKIENWWSNGTGESHYIPTKVLVTDGVTYPVKVRIELRHNDPENRLGKALEDK